MFGLRGHMTSKPFFKSSTSNCANAMLKYYDSFSFYLLHNCILFIFLLVLLYIVLLIMSIFLFKIIYFMLFVKNMKRDCLSTVPYLAQPTKIQSVSHFPVVKSFKRIYSFPFSVLYIHCVPPDLTIFSTFTFFSCTSLPFAITVQGDVLINTPLIRSNMQLTFIFFIMLKLLFLLLFRFLKCFIPV